jgi:hypothetical protein
MRVLYVLLCLDDIFRQLLFLNPRPELLITDHAFSDIPDLEHVIIFLL